MNKLNINKSAFMFFKICKTCKYHHFCNFCFCSESFDNAYEYSHFRGGFFVIPYNKVFILNKWIVTKVKYIKNISYFYLYLDSGTSCFTSLSMASLRFSSFAFFLKQVGHLYSMFSQKNLLV